MSDPREALPPAADPDLEVGQAIGEYEIEAKVGQGGFGTVYRAAHPLIGKIVAIKVLARRFSVDPEMMSRFIAEARSVNQINNRHIIDIFLFGTLPDGRAYYVMEYLDGEPLDALIDREHKVPLAQALPILKAIARALDAAHAKGITHRDLKPENVFLVKDADSGEVFPKLLDFGIAKLMGNEELNKHKTRTGIPIGTPYYMSPEQCRGRDVDHRTDYYAFGVVAYQMLTGRHPIDADDFMEIMIKQLADEPVPPSSIVTELPPEVDDAIAWLMKKNRDERPPSLVAAMKRFDREATITPVPTGAVPISVELEPLPRRHGPARSKLPIAIAALLAIAVGVWFATSSDPTPKPPAVMAPPPTRATPAPVVVAPPAPPAPVIVVPTPAVKPAVKKPASKKKPDRDDIIDVFGGKK